LIRFLPQMASFFDGQISLENPNVVLKISITEEDTNESIDNVFYTYAKVRKYIVDVTKFYENNAILRVVNHFILR